MKNITHSLIALFCMISVSLVAQTQKGSVMLGGMAGFASAKTGERTSTAISIAPMAGFFIIDQLAVGGALGVGFGSEKEAGETFNTTTFAIQPTARYYFNGSGNARFFGQADFRYASFKFGDADAEPATGFGAGVGVSFFLNDHVSIDGILGYDSFKFENNEDATGTFGIRFGVQAFIGGGNGGN